MSIFGFYYVTTILKQAGWPKRRGLFNSEAIVDTLIADATIDQMIDWSAALGACRPKLALQVIAWIYKDKNWEGENAPRIVDFINKAKDIWNARGNKSPHDIIEPFKLSKHFGKTIRSKDLKDNRIRTALELVCLEGLLWGLANPDRFKSWYESHYKNLKEKLPLMQKAGLEEEKVDEISEKISRSIDSGHNHSWYADYKNKKWHYIIFPHKIFKIDRADAKGYAEARTYGISLGIPEYQVDFSPGIK